MAKKMARQDPTSKAILIVGFDCFGPVRVKIINEIATGKAINNMINLKKMTSSKYVREEKKESRSTPAQATKRLQ